MKEDFEWKRRLHRLSTSRRDTPHDVPKNKAAVVDSACAAGAGPRVERAARHRSNLPGYCIEARHAALSSTRPDGRRGRTPAPPAAYGPGPERSNGGSGSRSRIPLGGVGVGPTGGCTLRTTSRRV